MIPYGTRSAGGIYESSRVRPHHPNSSHLCSGGSRHISRPISKWTDSIDHSAVHAEMRTCVVAPAR
eukprot:1572411-Pyramimonas_sp.AAC.1